MIMVTRRGIVEPFVMWLIPRERYTLYYNGPLPTLYINAMRHSNWRRIT